MTGSFFKRRILLAEDHTILRDGLRSLFSSHPEFEVVGEAADGLEAIAQVRRLTPDLVVMDLSMPRMNGIDAIREITRQFPGTKVLALTMHKTEEHVMDALSAGAAGYVLKTSAHGELIEAARSVLAGKTFLSPDVSGMVVQGYVGGKKRIEGTTWDTLSPREREILKLIAEGYKSREIAEQLCVSPKTVEKHRGNLMRKLDLHSVSAVTAFAARKGLIS